MACPFGAIRRPLSYARVRWRFRDEIELLCGKSRARSSHRSILHFTVERAASRFVGRVMQTLTRGSGMTPIDLDSYHFELGKIHEWTGERGGSRAPYYEEAGYYYGPFRTATDHLLQRTGFRVMLSLRDPRDALVSLYHNYAYEPTSPLLAGSAERGLAQRRREALQNRSIDDFVLEFSRPASHIRRSYEAYCQHLVGRPDVLLVRYEDMVSDFDTWLDQVVAFFELESAAESIWEIRDATDFTPSKTGPKRQVRPGEHRMVLAAETICKITTSWSQVLERLSYPPERGSQGGSYATT